MINFKLTKRETEVLKMISLDKTTISERLCVSRNTLKTHVTNILQKLQVHSVAQAIIEAQRLGLIKLEEFINE